MATKDQYKVLDYLKVQHQSSSDVIFKNDKISKPVKIFMLSTLNMQLESTLSAFNAYKGYRFRSDSYNEMLVAGNVSVDDKQKNVCEYYRQYF